MKNRIVYKSQSTLPLKFTQWWFQIIPILYSVYMCDVYYPKYIHLFISIAAAALFINHEQNEK